MNRMSGFIGFLAACLLACPLIARAAIPLSVYQSMIVPLPVKYANQGFFWGIGIGIPTISSLEYKGAIFEWDDGMDDMEGTMDDIATPFQGRVEFGIDSGLLFDGTFGYRWRYLRFELEGAGYLSTVGSVKGLPTDRFVVEKKNTDDDFGRFLAVGLLGNVYFDAHIHGTGITPFIGLGLGPMYIDYRTCILTDSGDSADLKNACFQFAYQIIAGVACTITDHTEMDLAFKYLQTKIGDYNVRLPAQSPDTDQNFTTFFLKHDSVVSFTTIMIEVRFS